MLNNLKITSCCLPGCVMRRTRKWKLSGVAPVNTRCCTAMTLQTHRSPPHHSSRSTRMIPLTSTSTEYHAVVLMWETAMHLVLCLQVAVSHIKLKKSLLWNTHACHLLETTWFKFSFFVCIRIRFWCSVSVLDFDVLFTYFWGGGKGMWVVILALGGGGGRAGGGAALKDKRHKYHLTLLIKVIQLFWWRNYGSLCR